MLKVMPEAHGLRLFHWQLLCTLTFRNPPRNRSFSLPIVFVWLRNVAEIAEIHFKRLIWVLRFEIGPRGGRGHYHLCLAGLPSTSLSRELCLRLESVWKTRSGGLAEVALYDQGRGGLDYILKMPYRWLSKGDSGTDEDDCEPMLSNSLLKVIRSS